MDKLELELKLDDVAMRRALWNWLMDQRPRVSTPVGANGQTFKPNYSMAVMSDDEVCAELRRILLPHWWQRLG